MSIPFHGLQITVDGLRSTDVQRRATALEPGQQPNPKQGTDRWTMEHDFISITPLRLNLTDNHELEYQKEVAR